MTLEFDHENLSVYQDAIGFVAWLDATFSDPPRSLAVWDQVLRASASIPVNIAEASGKRSAKERCQYIDTAYGSALECAACLDILRIHGCASTPATDDGKSRLSRVVRMLIGFRNSTRSAVREEGVEYATANGEGSQQLFDHENLNVYKRSLELVEWCRQLRRRECCSRPSMAALDKASTAVSLNIAEGNGTFSSKDRCRFIGYARTAALQSAATLDVLAVRHRGAAITTQDGKSLLAEIVRMLVAWDHSLRQE